MSEVAKAKKFHPFEDSKLLKSTKALLHPDWGKLTAEERLLHVALLAYVKHHNGIDLIGWNELGDFLHNAICEAVGDNAFVEWNERIKAESELPDIDDD